MAMQLLCQIVNSEIGGEWGEEAIKAQAVAAYTWVDLTILSVLYLRWGLKSGYSSKIEGCLNAVEGQTVMYNAQYHKCSLFCFNSRLFYHQRGYMGAFLTRISSVKERV